MRQKAFIISIVLTLFVLGIAAGVARAAFTPASPARDQEKAALEQALKDQSAQYNQGIAEANQRLAKANEIIRDMQTRLNEQESINQAVSISQTQTVPSASQPDQSKNILPVENAFQVARTAVNGWAEIASEQPELVNYQDKSAYEVKLSDGGSVYIDGSSGEVLFNSLTGSAKNVITPEEAKNAAVTYLKGGGVFSVTPSVYNGQPAYKVLFDVGHRIYVSLGGDVLYVELYKVVASSGGSGGGGGSAPAPSSHNEDHEDDHGGDDD